MEREMASPPAGAYIPSFTIYHVLPDLPGHRQLRRNGFFLQLGLFSGHWQLPPLEVYRPFSLPISHPPHQVSLLLVVYDKDEGRCWE